MKINSFSGVYFVLVGCSMKEERYRASETRVAGYIGQGAGTAVQLPGIKKAEDCKNACLAKYTCTATQFYHGGMGPSCYMFTHSPGMLEVHITKYYHLYIKSCSGKCIFVNYYISSKFELHWTSPSGHLSKGVTSKLRSPSLF